MSATATLPASPSFDYTNAPPHWPAVSVGDTVDWWSEEERPENPSPAIVTGIGPRGRLRLSVLVKDSMRFDTAAKQAVPHIDDPTFRPTATNMQIGHWDKRPCDKRRDEVISSLTAQVGVLLEAVSSMRDDLNLPKMDL